MKNEVTITVDQLATLMAASFQEFTAETHEDVCSTFRWMLLCIESEETANKFYDAACCKAAQMLAKEG